MCVRGKGDAALNRVSDFKDLVQLLTSEEARSFADVGLVADDGGEEVAAHRIVLCLRCGYLNALLGKHEKERVVRLEGVATTRVLRELIHWIYTNDIKLSVEEAVLKEVREEM